MTGPQVDYKHEHLTSLTAFLRFIAKKLRTACLRTNNRIDSLTNFSKCLYYSESETEVNMKNSSEKA